MAEVTSEYEASKALERTIRRREARRKESIPRGGYVLCDCSWVPEFSQRWLEILQKAGSDRQSFATCDRCNLTKHLRGDGWNRGEPPMFSISRDQLALVLPIIQAAKEQIALILRGAA